MTPHERLLKLLASGQLAAASREAQALLRAQPEHAESWALAAQVSHRSGRSDLAERLARKAAELEPHEPSHQVNLAICLCGARKFADALEIATALAPHVDRPDILANLGNVFSAAQDFSTAEFLFQRALQTGEGSAELYFNLGAVQRYLGKLSAAQQSFQKTIDTKPRHWEAILARSQLRTVSKKQNNIPALRKHLSTESKDWRGRVMLYFSIGKELEDTQDWAASFAAYHSGNQLQRRHTRYDAKAELGILQTIRQQHRFEVNESMAGCDSDEPIFVLGLPRSGTTLVERILSSHSEVCSLGELSDFTSTVVQQAKRDTGGTLLSREQLVSRSADLCGRDLGNAYLSKVSRLPRSTRRFVDKMPLNYLYLGLICGALPKSKIVHVVRDPIDSCFAIYKTLFRNAYPWSYDLGELADYFVAYYRLMEHWQACFPGRIIRVRYEDLVNDQANVSRDLLQRCDLTWEDSCLDFHKQDSASTTASAVQVRQPIYRSSIGRWQHFEKQLKPVAARLREAQIPPLDAWNQ